MLGIIVLACLLLFILERYEVHNNIYNKNGAVMTFQTSLKM